METKPLLYGIIGFLLGGLLVSTVAVTQDDKTDKSSKVETSTMAHKDSKTNELADLKGDDFDKAFIAEMIDHHQGAIDMAELTQSNAKHEEVKQLGRDIISAQTEEIDMMRSWQTQWGYKTSSEASDMHGM